MQIYQESALPTSASTVPSVFGVSWQNPSRITAKDGSSATLAFAAGGDNGAIIRGTGFSWKQLPASAVLDGLMLRIKGTSFSCNGTITLNIPGTDTKLTATLDESWGGVGYFWGLNSLTPADLVGLEVSASMADISGGDGAATMDYMEVTIYWHIELDQTYSPGLPSSFIYKVFSAGGVYLGDLPNVTSPFNFAQDINSAGAVLKTTCGTSPLPTTTTEAILDNNGDPIQTESSQDILASDTYTPLVQGNSEDNALFKNGNKLKVWMFNQWWPNGKLMFSGQMNRIDFSLGGDEQITVTTYSDGVDLENYYARGYPFVYTLDQVQTAQNSSVTIFDTAPGYTAYGQTFTTGVSAANIGEIQLMLQGSADVTVYVHDASGNLLGSTTQTVVGATFANATLFDFANLVPTNNSTPYNFTVFVGSGQSIDIGIDTSGGYANGTALQAVYGGGSGGGTFSPVAFDLWFKTGIGTPTTTTTYSTQDPVTGMARGILLDYNSRGGHIVERDFQAAGYTLTYTFNSATINQAIQKVRELSPAGYYSFVDLGDSVIDILPTSTEADLQVVVGRDIAKLDFSLTIEQVKNQLLFSGGDTGGGVNLFKIFQDTESAQDYEPRLAQKSDNRVTLDATAEAIGAAFIAENSEEDQETNIVLLNERVDITQFTPGKTIGFQNAGMFVEDLVLQIVRRVFTQDAVTLTIGRLPVSQTAEIQRLNREMLNEQTVENPTSPS